MARDREKQRAYQRLYYASHRDRFRAKNDLYHKNHKDQDRAYNRAYYEMHKNDYGRRRRCYGRYISHNYGLTLEQFDKMLVEQCGSCAICELPMMSYKDPAVDHCHITGKVRGLLHDRCNLGLGQFQDDAAVLRKAIEYLARRG